MNRASLSSKSPARSGPSSRPAFGRRIAVHDHLTMTKVPTFANECELECFRALTEPVAFEQNPHDSTFQETSLGNFGRYVIEGVLGRGGMGVVYSAREPEANRRVAIKTVGESTPGLQIALRAEIVALKRVQHPSVVSILEEGVINGVPWYAMELVEGQTLTEFNGDLWRGRRPSVLPTGSRKHP